MDDRAPGQPLVSIVMAARNTEQYIAECLDSILDQTYTTWELIVANDHSTDQTRHILERYARQDKRINVVDSSGKRLIPALQTAYAHSTGTLINRMDSDDKMPSYKLKVLVTAWQEYGRGTVIAGGTRHFTDAGEIGGGFRRYDRWLNRVAKRNAHYEEIYQECVIPSHCWIIHREDFDAAGAFGPVVYPEDYDLCFRFYKSGLQVIGVDKVLHFWRDRPERISRTWEEYRDNRYFDLKLRYFFELDRQQDRPLVLWGAGRNGKDMARLLLHRKVHFHWVCNNPEKIGKHIYGVMMDPVEEVPKLVHPQIMVVVSAPDARDAIRRRLVNWGKRPVKDYWFFS